MCHTSQEHEKSLARAMGSEAILRLYQDSNDVISPT